MGNGKGGAQIEDSLRVSYTSATDTAVTVNFDYQWDHVSGAKRTSYLSVHVDDPKHFDFDYNTEGRAISHLSDSHGDVLLTDTSYTDDRSQTMTVNYQVKICLLYTSPSPRDS